LTFHLSINDYTYLEYHISLEIEGDFADLRNHYDSNDYVNQ